VRADAAADAAAIQDRLERWADDFNAGRAEAVCDLFARDLVATYQGQPDRGFDAVCRTLQDSLRGRPFRFAYALDLQEVMVSGDLAVVRLVWTLEVRRPDGVLVERQEEPGLDVFRREPDGAWRIARYLAFSRRSP
jgi:steroid delta-isomerase